MAVTCSSRIQRELLDLEQERIVHEITRRKAKRVLLQVPEGLRPSAFNLSRRIEKKTSSTVIISADPCYGSCDLATSEASLLDVDLIVHLGHSRTHTNGEKYLFIEARSSLDVETVVKKAATELTNERVVGLASVVQHIGELEKARQILERTGKTVLIGERGGELGYDGQVLGCQFQSVKSISSKVDAFVVLAGGYFHGLGVRIATGKRTIVCDPFQNEVRDMEELAKRYLRKRYAAIDSFKEARRIGIIIGLKTGQFHPTTAQEMKDIVESKGRECVLLALREIDPIGLRNFSDIEGFVNTGCPRIALDDQERFTKPILNPDEVLIALGMKAWEEYSRDNNA
jgi:2-(3-amino-3-carboxypropyl)histidine synthase